MMGNTLMSSGSPFAATGVGRAQPRALLEAPIVRAAPFGVPGMFVTLTCVRWVKAI